VSLALHISFHPQLAPELELQSDVASIDFNLLGWTGDRVEYGDLLEEFQVTEEGNPMP
jgi:hypothetical protein